MSLPMTNTTAAVTPSVLLAERASNAPMTNAEPGTEPTGTSHDHTDLDNPTKAHHHHQQPPAENPAMRF